MILDKDLIRQILLYVEENGNDKLPVYNIEIDGYTDEEIKYHFKRLLEADIINGEVVGLQGNKVRFNCLTWYGHECLDRIRDKELWEKVKRDIEVYGVKSVTLDIIKAYAEKIIKEKLGI